MANKHPVLSGYLLDETVTLTLDEFSAACSVRTRQIVELVEEGILEPVTREHWRFSSTDLYRARKAVRLRQDLGINPPGVALVLDLLEEIQALRVRGR